MMSRKAKRVLVCFGFLFPVCGIGLRMAVADDPPVLQITPLGSNQFQIQITNGVSTGYYELYHTPVLVDDAYPWTLLSVGNMGQTNFTVDGSLNYTGFYFVGVGNDWDGDGVPNSQDADPKNPYIGQLTITIDSPTNNSVVQ